jgi:hypothetical protein
VTFRLLLASQEINMAHRTWLLSIVLAASVAVGGCGASRAQLAGGAGVAAVLGTVILVAPGGFRGSENDVPAMGTPAQEERAAQVGVGVGAGLIVLGIGLGVAAVARQPAP